MVSALGLVFPTSTALALADHPDRAGSASSLLGLGQYLMGAIVAPLVGLRGEDTAVPLGVVAVSCSVAAVGHLLRGRAPGAAPLPARRARRAPGSRASGLRDGRTRPRTTHDADADADEEHRARSIRTPRNLFRRGIKAPPGRLSPLLAGR